MNPKTKPRDSRHTVIRENTSQLELCLEAGFVITRNQPVEVALTILPRANSANPLLAGVDRISGPTSVG